MAQTSLPKAAFSSLAHEAMHHETKPLAYLALLLGILVSQHAYSQDKGATSNQSPSSIGELAKSMAQAADSFLKTLDAETRQRTVLAFEDPARRDWHNIPKPWRKGLQIRDMTPPQREACMALVATALSPVGLEKAKQIMVLEANIREGEKHLVDGAIRDPERYFLTIFGKPGERGAWGWSFEGHHLSINISIRDQAIIGDTPTFMGANPATVRLMVEGGPKVGSRTLAQEEQLAFELTQSLDEVQKKQAIIASEAPKEYHDPGHPVPPQLGLEGLPASRMSPIQQAKLRELLQVYCQNFATPLL